MTAPINLEDPGVPIPAWTQQAQNWSDLNTEVNGNPDFKPLTIKFAYLVGVIHDLCESVAYLLQNPEFARRVSYIPAYGLFASGIEILGRCVKGEFESHKPTLKAGLQWLADPRFPEYSQVSKTRVLTRTSHHPYTIDELQHLRHFAAHGQATSAFYTIDYELLGQLRPLLRDGLEHYWAQLKESEDLRANLALAGIVPLRGWPVMKTWHLLQGNARDGYHKDLAYLFDKFEPQFDVPLNE